MSASGEQEAADALSLDGPVPTELYAYRSRRGRTGVGMVYRRFATLREAVAYAVEHCGGSTAHLVTIEVGEQRFGPEAIRRLHLRAQGLDPSEEAA